MDRSKIRLGFVLVLSVLMAWSGTAFAQVTQQQVRGQFLKATQGKTVAWCPIWLGVLETEWTNIMKEDFERYGIHFVVRDSQFKPDVQVQTVETLINQHPDVLIVQSGNQTNTARVIKKAMDQGIYVVEVNMPSVQVSDAYVGIDAPQVGREVAEDMVKELGGGKTSGEIAILQGDPAAPYSRDQVTAALPVFKKDPHIKIVANLPTMWDSNKGSEIISTVIQAHPKLAGVWSVWGPQTAGAGQALRNAHSNAKIWVTTDGQIADYNELKQGYYYKMLSYRANLQAQTIVDAVLNLLQLHPKPGSTHVAYYTPLFWLNSPAQSQYSWNPKKF
jgi:ABC-type sugar transport system substrate-binding protein